jgi:hypothetical protein
MKYCMRGKSGAWNLDDWSSLISHVHSEGAAGQTALPTDSTLLYESRSPVSLIRGMR